MVTRPITIFLLVLSGLIGICTSSIAGEWDLRAKRRLRTPAMIGDAYFGSPLDFRANRSIDRLAVVADDLDAPLVLPSLNSNLTITEAGPVGIFSSNVLSVQQLQSMLRAGSSPSFVLAGVSNANATLTTSGTVGQIQNQLSSTALPYDIVALQAPTAYTGSVQNLFVLRNGLAGQTVYDAAQSGALLQGGTDSLTGGEDLDAFYFYDYIVRFDTRLVDATSGGVGRSKIAEGGSVLPQNRVFFRYNYFDNVRYSNSGISLNRYTPGFERAFLDNLASIELRAPMASGTISNSTFDGVNGFGNSSDVRLGNMTVYAKVLLIDGEQLAISGGTGVALPTAADVRVNYADGSPLLEVANNSVRLQPFLGGLWTPSDNWFAQGFVQYDVAANGNRVSINSTGAGLSQVGRLTDSSNLYADLGLGYWLYRSDDDQGLTGVIPMLELHQNFGIQSGDFISASGYQVGNFSGQSNLTNLVAGTTFEFASRSQFTVGYATSLGGGSDQQFDHGLTVNFSQMAR